MLKNRSVPTDTVLPHIVYQNVADAIAWLATAFGFIEHYRYGDPEGPISGAQMHLGEAWIMLNRVRAGRASPAQVGFETQSLTVFVDDVDAHFQRAKSAGAKIAERRGVLPEMAPIGREASWPGRPAPPGSPGAARLGPPPRE